MFLHSVINIVDFRRERRGTFGPRAPLESRLSTIRNDQRRKFHYCYSLFVLFARRYPRIASRVHFATRDAESPFAERPSLPGGQVNLLATLLLFARLFLPLERGFNLSRNAACNTGAWNSSSFSRYVAPAKEVDARRRAHAKESPEMAAILRAGRASHTKENRCFLGHSFKMCSLDLPFSYNAISRTAQLSIIRAARMTVSPLLLLLLDRKDREQGNVHRKEEHFCLGNIRI